MDRPCRSSWTGAHESFQAEEYDAGASPTIKRASMEADDSWTNQPKFLKMLWEDDAQTFNEAIYEERLLYIVLDLERHALVLSR
jgi:hypothetical protein